MERGSPRRLRKRREIRSFLRRQLGKSGSQTLSGLGHEARKVTGPKHKNASPGFHRMRHFVLHWVRAQLICRMSDTHSTSPYLYGAVARGFFQPSCARISSTCVIVRSSASQPLPLQYCAMKAFRARRPLAVFSSAPVSMMPFPKSSSTAAFLFGFAPAHRPKWRRRTEAPPIRRNRSEDSSPCPMIPRNKHRWPPVSSMSSALRSDPA